MEQSILNITKKDKINIKTIKKKLHGNVDIVTNRSGQNTLPDLQTTAEYTKQHSDNRGVKERGVGRKLDGKTI